MVKVKHRTVLLSRTEHKLSPHRIFERQVFDFSETQHLHDFATILPCVFYPSLVGVVGVMCSIVSDTTDRSSTTSSTIQSYVCILFLHLICFVVLWAVKSSWDLNGFVAKSSSCLAWKHWRNDSKSAFWELRRDNLKDIPLSDLHQRRPAMNSSPLRLRFDKPVQVLRVTEWRSSNVVALTLDGESRLHEFCFRERGIEEISWSLLCHRGSLQNSPSFCWNFLGWSEDRKVTWRAVMSREYILAHFGLSSSRRWLEL